MGHKVNPTGFRLGVIRGWDSRWYAGRNYKDLVYEDYKLRQLIQKRLANAAVSRIEIERLAGTQLSVTIHTAKPGIVIGKSGENVERLRQLLEQTSKKKVRLSILEIRNPEVEATLIARSIAEQIEKRISFRRAMKQAVQKAMRANAKGIKVIIGGRLGGAEIARSEKEVEGSVPLQTLRANIDYGLAEAHTTYGVIGIKVWVYHGDVLPERQREQGLGAAQAQMAAVPAPGGRGGLRGEGRGGPRGEGRGGPRGEGRGGPRGEGRGGPRPGSTEAGPRPSGARGTGAGGARGTGAGGQSRGTRGTGAGGAERAPRSAPKAAPDGGGIVAGKGPELSPSGDVVPAPSARELPAPEANAPSDATKVETTSHPTETEE